jgi:hypothetical protein
VRKESVCSRRKCPKRGVATPVPFQHPVVQFSNPTKHAFGTCNIHHRQAHSLVIQFSLQSASISLSFFPSHTAHPSAYPSLFPAFQHIPPAADTFHRAQFGSGHSLTILTVFRSSKGGEVVGGSLGVMVRSIATAS